MLNLQMVGNDEAPTRDACAATGTRRPEPWESRKVAFDVGQRECAPGLAGRPVCGSFGPEVTWTLPIPQGLGASGHKERTNCFKGLGLRRGAALPTEALSMCTHSTQLSCQLTGGTVLLDCAQANVYVVHGNRHGFPAAGNCGSMGPYESTRCENTRCGEARGGCSGMKASAAHDAASYHSTENDLIMRVAILAT